MLAALADELPCQGRAGLDSVLVALFFISSLCSLDGMGDGFLPYGVGEILGCE